MKTKVILFIVAAAIVTLSFTFASVKSTKSNKETSSVSVNNEPLGGLISEDKL